MLYHMSYTPFYVEYGVYVFECVWVEIKIIKNSPTGIRTPVFHVTGEDTNQLYYWRLLNKGKGKVDEGSSG